MSFQAARNDEYVGLTLTVEPRDEEAIVVHVRGELDLSTSPQMETDLLRLISDGKCAKLILDLRELTFLDSTGLRALWTTRQRAQSAGTLLFIESPSASVLRVLRVTKLDRVFQLLGVDEFEQVRSPDA